MDLKKLFTFREKFWHEISTWPQLVDFSQDLWWEATKYFPVYYGALVSIYKSPETPIEEKETALKIIKYIVSSIDLMPELICGPAGYKDDLYLIYLAVEKWHRCYGEVFLQSYGLSIEDPVLTLIEELAQNDLPMEVKEKLVLFLEKKWHFGSVGSLNEDSTDKKIGNYKLIISKPGIDKLHYLEEHLQKVLPNANKSILIACLSNNSANKIRNWMSGIQENNIFNKSNTGYQRLKQNSLVICSITDLCKYFLSNFSNYPLFFIKGKFLLMEETKRILFLFKCGIEELKLEKAYKEWIVYCERLNKHHQKEFFYFYQYVSKVYDFLSEEIATTTLEPVKTRYLKIITDSSATRTINEEIIKTYPNYWQSLQNIGYLDLSMNLSYLDALLDDQDYLTEVQAHFSCIVIDEYQDAKNIHERIFRKLASLGLDLLILGDDDQCIYASDGANELSLSTFLSNYPSTEIVEVSENKRSTQALLDATQNLISYNGQRISKTAFSSNFVGDKPWLLEEDFEFLPNELAKLLNDIKSRDLIRCWSDVVILFRSITERTSIYREALLKANLPVATLDEWNVLGNSLVFSMIEILKSVYLSNTDNIEQMLPFFEAVNVVERSKILNYLSKWQLAFRTQTYSSILDLFSNILKETEAFSSYEWLFDLTPFFDFIAGVDISQQAINLHQRMEYFLKYTEASIEKMQQVSLESVDSIQFMTIGQARGFKFPIVVIADVVEGNIPSFAHPNLRSELEQLFGIERPSLSHKEEERRLFYIGMSCAENRLIITTTLNNQSCFLTEFSYISTKDISYEEQPLDNKPSLNLLDEDISFLTNDTRINTVYRQSGFTNLYEFLILGEEGRSRLSGFGKRSEKILMQALESKGVNLQELLITNQTINKLDEQFEKETLSKITKPLAIFLSTKLVDFVNNNLVSTRLYNTIINNKEILPFTDVFSFLKAGKEAIEEIGQLRNAGKKTAEELYNLLNGKFEALNCHYINTSKLNYSLINNIKALISEQEYSDISQKNSENVSVNTTDVIPDLYNHYQNLEFVANKFANDIKSSLSPKEYAILFDRAVHEKTLAEIGEHYNLTRERVRQIEKKATDKLKKVADIKYAVNFLYKEIEECLEENGGLVDIKSVANALNTNEQTISLIIKVKNDEKIRSKDDFVKLEEIDKSKINWKKEIKNALLSSDWPIDIAVLAEKLKPIPFDFIFKYLTIEKGAVIRQGVIEKLNLSLAQMCIFVLRKAQKSLRIREVVSYIENIFGVEADEHAVTASLGRLPEILIVGNGQYALYENLNFSEETLATIRAKAELFLKEYGSFMGSQLVFSYLFQHEKEKYHQEFNHYMVLGILQDDARFVTKPGLMIGLASFSSDKFTSLEEEVVEHVLNYGPVTVGDIVESLSNRRSLFYGGVANILRDSKCVIAVKQGLYDSVSKIIGDKEKVNIFETSLDIALANGPQNPYELLNKVKNIGFSIDIYAIASWLRKKTDKYTITPDLFSLKQIPNDLFKYNHFISQALKNKISSIDLMQLSKTSLDISTLDIYLKSDYRLVETYQSFENNSIQQKEDHDILDFLFLLEELDF